MVVYAQSLDHVRLFVTLWTVAHQTPLSMKFSKQEYRSGLPTPGYLPNPGDCIFCIGRRILYHWATWEASSSCSHTQQRNEHSISAGLVKASYLPCRDFSCVVQRGKCEYLAHPKRYFRLSLFPDPSPEGFQLMFPVLSPWLANNLLVMVHLSMWVFHPGKAYTDHLQLFIFFSLIIIYFTKKEKENETSCLMEILI